MSLKQILEKRLKGEELTDDEKIIVQEYDELSVESNSKIELLEKEKELNIKKFENASSELENKLKEFSEISQRLNSVESEKATIMQLLEDEKSATKIKEEMARMEAEKKAKTEKEKEEKKKAEAISKYENMVKELQNELSAIKSNNDLFKFKYDMTQNKIKYPYLEKEIDTIINEVEVKGIELSEQIFKFLIESKNHEEELKKFKAKKEAGSSIFKNIGTQEVKEERKLDPRFGNINMELAKKYRMLG